MANITSTISARGSKGHHTFYLKVEETATSTANNTSTVKFDFWLVDDNNWYFYGFGSQITYTVTINGTNYSGNIPDHNDETTTDIRSVSNISIPHDNNGTKTLSFSFSVSDSTSRTYTPGDASTNSSITLTTIPRASSISVASSLTITNPSNNLTLGITSKANYYHRAWYKIDTGSETELTLENNGYVATTSKNFNLAHSLILAKMPTITAGKLTIRVQTYSNSTRTTAIGDSVSATCNVTIDTSSVKPTLSIGTVSTSAQPLSGYAVFGYSTLSLANVTSAVMTNSGATSVSVTAKIEGYSGASIATGTLTNPSNATITSNVLPSATTNLAANTLKFVVTSTDSRGARTTAEKYYTAIIYGYSKPNATLVAYRTNTISSTTSDGAGGYIYVKTVSGSVTNIPSSSNNANTMTMTGTYSGGLSGSIAQGDHKILAITSSATLTLVVTDKVGGSTTAVVSIGNATFPIILRDNGSGTVGVGFGTFPDGGKFQSALPIQAGVSSQTSLPNAGYWIHDTRNVEVTSATGDKQANFFFLMTGGGNTMPASGWWSLLHMRGWTGGYSSWELAGPADNADNRTTPLYVRGSNKNTDWGSWRQIYDSSNPPTSVANATRATNATYTDWTETNPSALTNYYLPFGSGYSTNTSNRGLLSNNGLMYRTRQGTTSAVGYSILNLGNSTATGTAGNKMGVLRIYASDTTFTDIYAQGGGNGYTAYLPKLPANSYLESSKSIWAETLTGGNTATINASGYSRIRVYALTWGVQHIFEIDLSDAGKALSGHGLTDSSYPFQGGSVVVHRDGAGTTGGSIMYYSVSCKVSSDKKTLWVTSIGYSSLGTSFNAFTTRNGNNEYYVYRVDGIV